MQNLEESGQYLPALQRGMEELQLQLCTSRQHRLLLYLAMIRKWNRRLNLSGMQSPQQMISGMLLDSLSLLSQIGPNVRSILDLGSGVGLPGIPLAIACPQHQVSVLDRSTVRCRFLSRVCLQLELGNVEVVEASIQDHHPSPQPDLLVARALMSVPRLLQIAAHLFRPDTEMLLQKGANLSEELAQMPTDFRVDHNHLLTIPGLTHSRRILRIVRCEAPA